MVISKGGLDATFIMEMEIDDFLHALDAAAELAEKMKG